MATNFNSEFRPVCNPSEIHVFWMNNGRVCSGSFCNDSESEEARMAYRTIKAALDFFDENFQICGIDGEGTVPNIYIGMKEKNAESHCHSTGKASDCFLRFNNEFLTREVIVHEFTHSVVARNSPLDSCGEPGALNESISDVMGIAFNHAYFAKMFMSPAEPWVVKPIERDLSQHITMDDYKGDGTCTRFNDWGHIHANSRIPSHAFYVAVTESRTVPHGVMSRIWFKAMLLSETDETFRGFADNTLRIAEHFFPKNNRITGSVARSWVDVGVLKLKIGNLPSMHHRRQVKGRHLQYSAFRH